MDAARQAPGRPVPVVSEGLAEIYMRELEGLEDIGPAKPRGRKLRRLPHPASAATGSDSEAFFTSCHVPEPDTVFDRLKVTKMDPPVAGFGKPDPEDASLQDRALVVIEPPEEVANR